MIKTASYIAVARLTKAVLLPLAAALPTAFYLTDAPLAASPVSMARLLSSRSGAASRAIRSIAGRPSIPRERRRKNHLVVVAR